MNEQSIQSRAASLLRQLLRKPAPAPESTDPVEPVEPATPTDPVVPAV